MHRVLPQSAPVRVIVNATAGQGCPEGWAQDVQGKFRAHGLDADVQLLGGGQQILAAVTQALREGAQTIVAAGGDGTVSAVASKLAGTGIPLGVLPMGTLNHFAKDLGLPLEL